MMEQNPSSLRILVADDNDATTKMFGWMIEILGHEVRVVLDGPAAIREAKSFLPHVLMLDINLPGLSGYEVCEQLHAEPALQKSVFVAQTGWDQPEYIERSKQAGFDHHWVKPILLDRIEELLSSLSGRKAVAKAANCK
jgi:CheY-like chemotaxis protein